MTTPMQEDKHTHQQLEQAVRLAVVELMKFTGFDGFVLEMPTGAERPPHLIVVGTAAEIRWLLDQRAARRRDAEQAAEMADSAPRPARH
jgi:hypothetical protein